MMNKYTKKIIKIPISETETIEKEIYYAPIKRDTVTKKQKSGTTKNKPTVEQMAKSFVKAMSKWAGSGFATVSEDEYKRRRSICNDCHGGWRCPKCGCMLWAKAALKTETCEKW